VALGLSRFENFGGIDLTSSNTLILSTMRDEGPYILEWLAYHRTIGFSDFLIYTNDCRDGTDLLLDRLAQNGEIHHERNNVLRRGPQKSAYKAAMKHPAYLKADWVLASDVDEFLNIQIGSGQVEDLLNRFPDADAIPVCWRLFSNNSHAGLLNEFSTVALTDAESTTAEPGDVGRFVKSMFRPIPEIERIGSHAPVYSKSFEPKAKWGAEWFEAEPKLNPLRPRTIFGYQTAQMNHYAVRTIDTFLLKRDRGDVNYMKDRLELKYWTRWCRGGSEDKSILRFLPAMRAEFERLLQDPIVKALHDASLVVHSQRLGAISAHADVLKLKDEIYKSAGMTPAIVKRESANPHSDALKIKAPGRHKNRLKLLEEMPKNGRCAEIGVWNGGFSESILEVTNPERLVLIDPWEMLAEQSEDEWTHKRHKDHAFMLQMHDHVASCYGHRADVEIRKGFSADVLSSFPDDYFDWVYIDGNHLYDFVRRDIEIAFKKVRPGGTIAGDDFFWKQDGRMHVKEAVIDEMRAQGMKNRPTRFGQQFMIRLQA
jgi:predicted O-methyltransferase YrrM